MLIGELDTGRRLEGRQLQETSHVLLYKTSNTYQIARKGIITDSRLGYDSVSSSSILPKHEIENISDCPVERTMLLNYQPMCTMNGHEFEIFAGHQLLIGLAQESYTVALSGEYDVAGVPLSSFIDYESDFPITVVDKSWKTSTNWPGEDMVWVE